MRLAIVCYANFCRSPVAENIIKNKYPDIHVESYGINPMISADMDQRSRKFLFDNEYQVNIHTPKKISNEVMRNSDMILVLDAEILMILNSRFPAYSKKVKTLNYNCPSIALPDPYKLPDEEYLSVMSNIKKVCCNLKLK